MNKWKYLFNCDNCLNMQEMRGGRYCVPMVDGREPIHADDDYCVRCDEYEPAQEQIVF